MYSDSAIVIRPSYSDSAILFGFGHGDSPSYSDSAIVIRPSYSDSAIVALRKKGGGLKNSFGQVKNEKGLVSMHDLSSFTTTRIVVVNYGSNHPNC